MLRHLLSLLLPLALALGTAAAPAEAQDEMNPSPDQTPPQSDSSILRYEAEYFAIYEPVTALDLVERVPGFTLDAGASVRGFGGAAGNVLIDGERPSAKRQSLEEILGQIPADDVERIELVRGRVEGIDMRGQSVVVNVVRGRRELAGFAEAVLRLNEGVRVSPSGEISLSGELGRSPYTIALRHFELEDLDDQPETVLDADGVAIERRDEQASIRPDQTFLTANFERDLGAWETHLNNELLYSDFQFFESSPAVSIPGETPLGRTSTAINDELIRLEVGADARRALTPAVSLKLIALQTLAELDSRQRFFDLDPTGSARTTRQTIDERSGESILRGLVTFAGATDRTWELGLEGAFNFLESTVDLSLDSGAGPIPQELPIDETRVEERRAEIFGNLSWKPAPDWSLEVGLTTELSELTQTGDAEERRSFVYVKPSLIAVYSLTDRQQIRFEGVREVAQLDFADFVSSVTLNEQTTNLGNPQLEPQRSWIAQVAWENRFTASDTLSLLVERRWIEAVQDLVPIGGEFDAPGNIGDGILWRTRIEGQIDLARIGIRHGLLEGWWEHLESEVRDPVTSARRQLQFLGQGVPYQSDRVRLQFRQDFPDAGWAWGADYFFGSPIHEFRIDEQRRTEFGTDDIDFFVETTRFLGIKIRLDLERAEPRVRRRRTLFAGPRSEATVRAVELRDREPEMWIVLTVRRSF